MQKQELDQATFRFCVDMIYRKLRKNYHLLDSSDILSAINGGIAAAYLKYDPEQYDSKQYKMKSYLINYLNN